MRVPWKVIAALVGLWIVALLIIHWSRSMQPTPASFEAYLFRHDLDKASGSGRTAIINHAADQLNRLSWDQREQLRQDGADRELFKKMTPDERSRFLDLTLPQGMHELMVALNKMKPEKRRKIVEDALTKMRNADPAGAPPPNDPQTQKIISEGLESFYKDSSPEVKLDFAPLIEQIQKTTQSFQ